MRASQEWARFEAWTQQANQKWAKQPALQCLVELFDTAWYAKDHDQMDHVAERLVHLCESNDDLSHKWSTRQMDKLGRQQRRIL